MDSSGMGLQYKHSKRESKPCPKIVWLNEEITKREPKRLV